MRKITYLDKLEEVEPIIEKCQFCHVAMVDSENKPYVLPFNFGYHQGYIYLHSDSKGKKIDILKKNPSVCIHFSTDHELFRQHEQVACSYGMRYRSVLVSGRIEFVTEYNAKIEALNAVMKQYVNHKFTYSKPSVDNVCVYRVKVEELSGKVYGYE